MITLADNQAGIAAALHAKGAALALGRVGEVTATQLAQALAQCQQPGALAAMSSAALALVDGLGAARVARAMAGF
jgi:spore coat polysaccharide biosynthesis predicted glycosyltransferase SpsG